MYSNICYTCSLSNFQFIVENNLRCYFAMWLVHKTQMNCNSHKIPSSSCNILELWKNKCDIQGERCKIKGAVIKLECYSRMYFLQDLLVCSIARYFYKLWCIVSNKSTLKYYTPKCVILYLLFILLYSICISYKLGKVKQIEKQVVTDLAQHPCQIMVQNNQLSK